MGMINPDPSSFLAFLEQPNGRTAEPPNVFLSSRASVVPLSLSPQTRMNLRTRALTAVHSWAVSFSVPANLLV